MNQIIKKNIKILKMTEKIENHSNHYCTKCKGTGICQHCISDPSVWDIINRDFCNECDAKKICPRCNGTGQSNLVN